MFNKVLEILGEFINPKPNINIPDAQEILVNWAIAMHQALSAGKLETPSKRFVLHSEELTAFYEADDILVSCCSHIKSDTIQAYIKASKDWGCFSCWAGYAMHSGCKYKIETYFKARQDLYDEILSVIGILV